MNGDEPAVIPPAADGESGRLRIEVVHAGPDVQHLVVLDLPAGAVVADALTAAADLAPFAGLALGELPVGVFGERVDPARPLETHDRVEIYRPLRLDPLEARRRRVRRD